jgi:hypothetical protein
LRIDDNVLARARAKVEQWANDGSVHWNSGAKFASG